MTSGVGAERPFDLFALTIFGADGHSVQRRMFGFLELMWTLIADVDIESERFRWAGGARFTLMAIVRVLWLRRYNGRLHYLQGNAGDTKSPRFSHITPRNIPSDWTTVVSNFSYFMAMNVPWCSTDVQPAPRARLGDGSLDLVWMENATMPRLLRLLLDTESGTYIQEPYVRYEKVQAFLLEPEQGTKYGILDLDGEVIPYQSILAEVLPHAATLFVPLELDELAWMRP